MFLNAQCWLHLQCPGVGIFSEDLSCSSLLCLAPVRLSVPQVGRCFRCSSAGEICPSFQLLKGFLGRKSCFPRRVNLRCQRRNISAILCRTLMSALGKERSLRMRVRGYRALPARLLLSVTWRWSPVYRWTAQVSHGRKGGEEMIQQNNIIFCSVREKTSKTAQVTRRGKESSISNCRVFPFPK